MIIAQKGMRAEACLFVQADEGQELAQSLLAAGQIGAWHLTDLTGSYLFGVLPGLRARQTEVVAAW